MINKIIEIIKTIINIACSWNLIILSIIGDIAFWKYNCDQINIF